MIRASGGVRAVVLVLAVLAAQGCAGGSSTSSSSSGGDASTDCATIEKDIHDAAVKRGLDPNTVCTSTNPQVMSDFQTACANARAHGC